MTTTATVKPVETRVLTAEDRGQNSREQADEVANATVGTENAHEEPMDLLSVVLEKPNLWKAYERVLRNKGAASPEYSLPISSALADSKLKE